MKYKINWNERNPENFQMVKSIVKRIKRLKQAKTCVASNGQFYIGDENGNNLMPSQYEDLRLSNDVWTAWKNIYIVDHWNKQENRNIKGTYRDIANAVGNDKNIPRYEPTIDKESKVKIEKNEEVFEREDYSIDRMEDWG